MTKDFNVSVSMDQAAAVKTGVILKQGDFGFDLKITVLDFVVTGTTPQIVFRKAMGAVESTDVTASGNVYTYTFKGTELDVPGKVFCDLKLKNSTTQRISTASFQFEVVADTLDGLAEEASSYSDTVEQLLENTLQKSETSGLVKNDGTIDTEIEGIVSSQGTQITELTNKVSEDQMKSWIVSFCRLRSWNDETGFPSTTNTKRLSCVAPIHYPMDIYMDANDVTDNMSLCRLYYFSRAWANPSVLIGTEDIYIGKNGRHIVKIPANSYTCFMLSQKNNTAFNSVDDAQNIKFSFSPFIDSELNTTGAAADAAAVKTEIDALYDEIDEKYEDAFEELYTGLSPEFVNMAKDSYIKSTSEISATKTQFCFLGGDGVHTVGDTYTDWYVTDEITIDPSTFYYINASAQYNTHRLYNIMDSNSNILAYEEATSSSILKDEEKLILTPHNAAKIQIASVTGANGAAIFAAEANGGKNPSWNGKKWVCVGDSLTAVNIRTTMHYHDYIAEQTGISVINLGAGGTGYKRSYAGEGPFIDRVDQIPLDADVVTIFGSGNDAIYDIGDPSDTGTDTLCSAINATIEAIFNRITTCQLGIVTPCPWSGYNPADNTNWMARYSAAIVEICKRWGIPCLDLYHCSNLRPWDAAFRAAAYSKDDGGGVHPDETGHKILAPHFEAFLDSLLLR